jgi:hypothetical protein
MTNLNNVTNWRVTLETSIILLQPSNYAPTELYSTSVTHFVLNKINDLKMEDPVEGSS